MKCLIIAASIAVIAACTPESMVSPSDHPPSQESTHQPDTLHLRLPDPETATVESDPCEGAQIDRVETYQLVRIIMDDQNAGPVSEMRHKVTIAGVEYNMSDAEEMAAEADPEKVCRDHLVKAMVSE